MVDDLPLRTRLQERLDARNISPFEAARQISADRSYVNDVLIGRKKSVSGENLIALSRLLDCDPEYLIGLQDIVRRPTSMYPDGLPLKGVCEAGVWRSPGALPKIPATLPVGPDLRYVAQPQCCFLKRGSAANELNIEEGSVLICVENPDLYEAVNASVVVRATRRSTGEMEVSIRVVKPAPQGAQGKVLAALNPDFPEPNLPFEDGGRDVKVEILGRVVEVIRMVELPQ